MRVSKAHKYLQCGQMQKSHCQNFGNEKLVVAPKLLITGWLLFFANSHLKLSKEDLEMV
jgi:hypothetical protein